MVESTVFINSKNLLETCFGNKETFAATGLILKIDQQIQTTTMTDHLRSIWLVQVLTKQKYNLIGSLSSILLGSSMITWISGRFGKRLPPPTPPPPPQKKKKKKKKNECQASVYGKTQVCDNLTSC